MWRKQQQQQRTYPYFKNYIFSSRHKDVLLLKLEAESKHNG